MKTHTAPLVAIIVVLSSISMSSVGRARAAIGIDANKFQNDIALTSVANDALPSSILLSSGAVGSCSSVYTRDCDTGSTGPLDACVPSYPDYPIDCSPTFPFQRRVERSAVRS